MDTAMPFRDVGYARLSHHDPDEQGAIARQKQDIRRVSERTGGQLLDPILVDNAVSASKYAHRKRKDYPKLLEMARAGLVDRAVIYDVDRLLRIPKELEELIDVVEELGDRFAIVAVNGSMDLTTSQGIYHARISVADAAKASDDTSRRLRSKFDQRAEQGLPTRGGDRPFGWTTGGMDHDPVESALLREAAADVLERGEGLNTIARRWNKAGVRTRRGGPWSNRTVRAVLTSPRNAGRRIHRGEDVGEAAWPAIIDPDTHSRLCRFLAERAREPGRRTPFTGLFAATDGRGMHRESIGKQQRRIYRTYRPSPGLAGPRTIAIGPAETLEDLTLEILFSDVEAGAVAGREAERRRVRPKVMGEDPSAVEREMVELAEDKAERRITRAEWLAMRRPIERRLAAARTAEARADDLDMLEAIDLDVRDRWWQPVEDGGYSDDRKRRILFTVFERIEIAPAPRLGPGFDPDRVTPIYRA